MNPITLTKPPPAHRVSSGTVRRPVKRGDEMGSWFPAFVLGCILLCTACRTPEPPVPPPPVAIPAPPAADPVVIRPASAVTNSLRHVTYTFALPHPPARGYIIEESVDGEEWFVYGRSTSSDRRLITIVDATPDSGKQWRVSLP